MKKRRFSIKIAGASGQGINSIGELVAKTLKNSGYRIFAYREYPSLIKGGCSSYQIDISDHEIASSESKCDILVCMDRMTLYSYIPTVKKDGIIVHSLPKLKLSEIEPKFPGDRVNEARYLSENNIQIEFYDAIAESKEKWGKSLYANTLFTGFIWQLINEDIDKLKKEINDTFASKPEVIPANLEALDIGFRRETTLKISKLEFDKHENWDKSYIITGNSTLALGAIKAGMRAYYGYPMTPASSILTYLADTSHETGILIKQAEDEITAVQLTIGSMFAGTRAMTATSGGGFDLMTETISLSGISETPLVIVLAQRSGPGTGLPTWTGAGDLNAAVYSGHGEFPRAVLAISDARSAYSVIQNAFNIAEEFQIPVIVLTEKQIAESLYNISDLSQSISIERGLVVGKNAEEIKPEARYELTDSGISSRWIPGSSNSTYDANSDEHWLDGSESEKIEQNQLMYEKRMRKIASLKNETTEPELFGNENAEYVLVGWGSTKGAVLDAFEETESQKFSYLHYEHVYPLRTEKLKTLINQGKKIILIESNYTGQLGNFLQTDISKLKFADKILKFNGRPFFVDEIISYLEKY